MNWGDIPDHMLDGAAQIRKAQENLQKTINDEINRRCYAWRMKVATLLQERESFRDCLESVESGLAPEIKMALDILRAHDSLWFSQTTPDDYIRKLIENS